MIQKGDTVRVTAPGIFQGQEVKVLVIDGRRMRGKVKRAYKLLTTWHGMVRTSYFTENEITLIEAKKEDTPVAEREWSDKEKEPL